MKYFDAATREHLDAETPGFSMFVDRALNYIMTEVFNTKVPPLKGKKFVPWKSNTPPGAKSVTYKRYTRAGIAQWITNYGADLPSASLWVYEATYPIYDMGASYRYTIRDLLSAMFANSGQAGAGAGPPMNLDLELASAALIAIEKKLDTAARMGTTGTDSDGYYNPTGISLVGLLNLTSATLYTVPVGATNSQLWTSKTPDEIAADINGIAANATAITYELEQPTNLIVPIAQYGVLASKRMGDGSDKTIKEFVESTSPWFGRAGAIDQWQYAAKAGAGSTDRMVAYQPDVSRIWHDVPIPFRQEPPQLKNLEVVVNCWASSGGVQSPYPLSVNFGDGI